MRTRNDVIDTIRKDDGNAFLREVDYVSGTKAIVIKDLMAVDNQVVSNASQMLENFMPRYNSTVVNNLRKNDFDIIGIANMDEFAMGSANLTSFFGSVNHPFNDGYIPGGSSGGSAYLVAKGLVDVALGTDTGGSVRQPAAHCGIYGLKPTYGLISRYGVYSFASSFDTTGIFSKDINLVGQTLNALASNCDYDQTNYCPADFNSLKTIDEDVSNMTIGIMNEWFNDELDPEVKASLLKKIDQLKAKGCNFVDVSVANTQRSFELYMMLAYSEASSNLNRYDGIKYGHENENNENMYIGSRSAFGLEVRKRLVIGTFMTSSANSKRYYEHSQKIRQKMTNDFMEIFETCDIIIGPTTPNRTHKPENKMETKDGYLSDKYSIPANLVGIPSLNIPCEYTKEGFAVGMQLMANKYQENKLIQLAKALEETNE